MCQLFVSYKIFKRKIFALENLILGKPFQNSKTHFQILILCDYLATKHGRSRPKMDWTQNKLKIKLDRDRPDNLDRFLTGWTECQLFLTVKRKELKIEKYF